jgi:membrane protein implicated in regulation of membrane protease activity
MSSDSEGDGEVGLFSWDRWGVDSLLMISAFSAGGGALLVRWLGTRGPLSLSTAALLFAAAAAVLVVEARTPFKRTEFRGYYPEGKGGVVTMSSGGACSVRVDGLEWTASHREGLAVGDVVTVVGREGLHLSVKKAEKGSPEGRG